MLRKIVMLGLLGSIGAASSFEVFRPAGISFVLRNSPTPQKYLIETMGGGVALFDYNRDGLLDVFFVNGGKLTASMPVPETYDRSDPKYWNRLFRQNRDGSFTDVTETAGLNKAGESNYGMGVAVGDFDNDGFQDLYVTSYGKNILYHNNGNGTFTDVTGRAGVAAGGWSASAGFFDYDNDGLLDLFVTRYMEWDTKHNGLCGGTVHVYCPPANYPATTNLLYHNNGDLTFTDVSKPSGIAAERARSLGVAFNDYDGDGYADIFVANDGMQQFLFHNNRDGTFTERALETGVGFSDEGGPFSGMGVDFRDYDDDGWPDIIVTNLAKQVYALYRNDGHGSFSYRSLPAGLGVLSAGNSGWGVHLEDFNNDGWKDLFVAQSHVMDNVEQADPLLHYLQPPMLAINHDGRFETGNPGTSTPVAGRGASFGDINNDGWMDVVESVLGENPLFFRNRGGGQHWLTLALEGTRSNRDAYGAIVRANGQTQYVNSAGSYLSASDKRVHFGLGNAKLADVEILWPSRAHQSLKGVSADQILAVREPAKP